MHRSFYQQIRIRSLTFGFWGSNKKTVTRPWACSAQGFAACGVMRPFLPEAAKSWIAAASSLACCHPPPTPRVRVATPVLPRELRSLPRPVPGHRALCSRPFVASEPGCRRQALVTTPGRDGTRNAARRPGSGGRPRGCGFEEQGGGMCAYIEGVYPYTERILSL